MREVSKAELIALAESEDSLTYMGKIDVGAEVRIYYRSRIGEGDNPQGWELIYVVE